MITEETLWKYIDGNLSSDERKEVEQYMSTDPDVLDQYKKLFRFHLTCIRGLAPKKSKDLNQFAKSVYRSTN